MPGLQGGQERVGGSEGKQKFVYLLGLLYVLEWLTPIGEETPQTHTLDLDFAVGKMKFTEGKIDLSHFWFANFWDLDPLPRHLLVRYGVGVTATGYSGWQACIGRQEGAGS